MINDNDDEKYYFAVKSKLELYSFEWLKSKKEAIINNDISFQIALDEALNYQTIKANSEQISKLKPYISQYKLERYKISIRQRRLKKV